MIKWFKKLKFIIPVFIYVFIHTCIYVYLCHVRSSIIKTIYVNENLWGHFLYALARIKMIYANMFLFVHKMWCGATDLIGKPICLNIVHTFIDIRMYIFITFSHTEMVIHSYKTFDPLLTPYQNKNHLADF